MDSKSQIVFCGMRNAIGDECPEWFRFINNGLALFEREKIMRFITLAVLSLSVLCHPDSLSASDLLEAVPRVTGFSRTLGEKSSMNDSNTVATRASQQNSAFVNATETLVGNTAKGSVPVTLVQRAGTEFWVVQSPPQLSENGAFTSTVRFPGDRRNAPSQFMIVVISVPEEHRLSRCDEGAKVFELPRDAAASPIYRVQRIAAPINYSAVERQETRLE